MRTRSFVAGLTGLVLVGGMAGCTVILPDTPTTPASPAATKPATSIAQQVSNFAGSWDTNYGLMTLTITNRTVTGDYGKVGKIKGTTSDDDKVLTATWTEGDQTGAVSFRLSDDGEQITGIWNEDGGPKKKDWTGSRIHAATQVK